jgi:hypothetical protein
MTIFNPGYGPKSIMNDGHYDIFTDAAGEVGTEFSCLPKKRIHVVEKFREWMRQGAEHYLTVGVFSFEGPDIIVANPHPAKWPRQQVRWQEPQTFSATQSAEEIEDNLSKCHGPIELLPPPVSGSLNVLNHLKYLID